ncbi:MAG TPA: hypothetical protein VFF73_37195 [Planctomycetota bacterium]|nr:hypothetical protein [Planctomycetota bacterium]
MAIHTDRPGGGDDAMVVHRARNADEARRVRAALEGAGIPVDLPDQAIDAWFSVKTEELHVKVALKHWAKAVKAIESAIPREEAPSPILEADDRQAAAAATLQEAPVAPERNKDEIPASALDKDAQRAFYVACGSIFLQPIGLIAAFWGASVWLEMSKRPNDYFRRKTYAQIATFAGAFIGTVGTFLALVTLRHRLMH